MTQEGFKKFPASVTGSKPGFLIRNVILKASDSCFSEDYNIAQTIFASNMSSYMQFKENLYGLCHKFMYIASLLVVFLPVFSECFYELHSKAVCRINFCCWSDSNTLKNFQIYLILFLRVARKANSKDFESVFQQHSWLHAIDFCLSIVKTFLDVPEKFDHQV